MAIQFTTVAYGVIILGGVVLFATGHRTAEAPPAPTTPGLTLARAGAPGTAPIPSAVTAAGFTLVSASVELPASDRQFPPGPHADVIQNNCTACHSVGMVMNQPTLTPTAWEGEVNKMRNVYKAPVSAEDVPAIVEYLASVKGAK